MKRIEVAAAIIIKDRKVYATQRGYGEWQGWWEFPGGKIEPGEQPQDALKREIMGFTETHIHRVSDAIQPSHPLSSASPLAPNPSQHQSLFQ